MHKDPQIAPPAAFLRYIAVFHRAFVAIDDYTRRGDRPGMLLGGWLADALHNVPSLLWHYSPDGWHSPQNTDAWLTAFPGKMQRRGAPEDVVRDSERIVAHGGEAHELGIRDDLGDFDLAPTESLDTYLETIYLAFLSMRVMRNYGARPHATWQGLEQVWTERADAQAAFNGLMASVLLPVPSGLVRWGQFDKAAFRHAALASNCGFPLTTVKRGGPFSSGGQHDFVWFAFPTKSELRADIRACPGAVCRWDLLFMVVCLVKFAL